MAKLVFGLNSVLISIDISLNLPVTLIYVIVHFFLESQLVIQKQQTIILVGDLEVSHPKLIQ